LITKDIKANAEERIKDGEKRLKKYYPSVKDKIF